MKIDKDFIFQICHSLDRYESKEKAKLVLSTKRIKE
jgi:hypothetical protein